MLPKRIECGQTNLIPFSRGRNVSRVVRPSQAIVLRDSMCGLFDVDKTTLGDKGRRVSTFFILATIVGAVIVLTALGLAQVRTIAFLLPLLLLPALLHFHRRPRNNPSHAARISRHPPFTACAFLV